DPLRLVGDVVGEGEGGAGVVGADLLGQGPDAVQIDVGEGDPGPLSGQHPRHRLAQPAGGAGDQGGLAGDAPAHAFAPAAAAASSMNRAMSRSRCVTPPASWVVSTTSTRL